MRAVGGADAAAECGGVGGVSVCVKDLRWGEGGKVWSEWGVGSGRVVLGLSGRGNRGTDLGVEVCSGWGWRGSGGAVAEGRLAEGGRVG